MLVDLLVLLPTAMISILAGLAFLGAIQNSMSEMIAADNVQVGLPTFLVTTSELTFGGIGLAFWGVVVGIAAWHLEELSRNLIKWKGAAPLTKPRFIYSLS